MTVSLILHKDVVFLKQDRRAFHWFSDLAEWVSRLVLICKLWRSAIFRNDIRC